MILNWKKAGELAARALSRIARGPAWVVNALWTIVLSVAYVVSLMLNLGLRDDLRKLKDDGLRRSKAKADVEEARARELAAKASAEENKANVIIPNALAEEEKKRAEAAKLRAEARALEIRARSDAAAKLLLAQARAGVTKKGSGREPEDLRHLPSSKKAVVNEALSPRVRGDRKEPRRQKSKDE